MHTPIILAESKILVQTVPHIVPIQTILQGFSPKRERGRGRGRERESTKEIQLGVEFLGAFHVGYSNTFHHSNAIKRGSIAAYGKDSTLNQLLLQERRNSRLSASAYCTEHHGHSHHCIDHLRHNGHALIIVLTSCKPESSTLAACDFLSLFSRQEGVAPNNILRFRLHKSNAM